MVLIKSPLSPSDTCCEQRLTKDGKKTPIRQVYAFITGYSGGFPVFASPLMGDDSINTTGAPEEAKGCVWAQS